MPTLRFAFRAAVPPGIERVTRDVLDARDAQFDRASQQVLSRLGELSRSILAELAESLSGTLATRLRALTDALAALTEQWARDVTTTIHLAQSDAVEIGQELVDARLLASSIELLTPDVTLELMDVLKDFSADKVQGLASDLRQQVTQKLRLGALGQLPTEQLIQDVADIVPPLGKLKTQSAARAETIVITEVGRVHSLASWQRLQEAVKVRPDLQKEWLHSGLTLNPRSGHQALSGNRVAALQPFQVAARVGGRRESLMFPRDPVGSAQNTVRCKCVALPYLPEWSEDG